MVPFLTPVAVEVYLNGRFLPPEAACVPVMDRGFLFGDAVYEVVPAYGGRLFLLDRHLRRLEHSLARIRMDSPLPAERWHEICGRLLAARPGTDQNLYIQITRGVMSRRDHRIPEHVEPTVFVRADPRPPPPAPDHPGLQAVLLEDIRWAWCDIKTTALLANILLKEEARRRGADEALLQRDSEVTEGASSNVFAVLDGKIVTPPKGPALLPGITRDLVLEQVCAAGLPCSERPLPVEALRRAEEIWITSSTREVVPVVRLDGEAVGSGQPGPLWSRVRPLFRAAIETQMAGSAE